MLESYLAKHNTIPLFKNLMDLKPEELFHDKHSCALAHPANILMEKLSDLNIRLKSLLNHQYDNFRSDPQKKSISNYILELDSFYHSLFLIIKCLTPPQGVNNQDVTIWLEFIKSQSYNDFVISTDKNKKYFSNILNKLKHDNFAISTLTVNNHKNVIVHGFFIHSNFIGGVEIEIEIDTDQKIHEFYCGSTTAFSFNHFILSSIGCIFQYMYYLNDALFKNRTKVNFSRQEKIVEILSICENIDQSFFPDEYSRAYALINRQKNGSISLKYPYKYKSGAGEVFENIYNVSLQVEISLKTNSSNNVVPYIGLMNR